jgi:tetrahydromethanopterin S-methyltransferase subunit G
MPSEVEKVAKRIQNLEAVVSQIQLTAGGSTGVVSADVQREVVIDTSKYDELESKVDRVSGEMDTKFTEALNDVQLRFTEFDHVKTMMSTVDGLTLHLELLHKRLDTITERVSKLEDDVSTITSSIVSAKEQTEEESA